jgi:branched-chain amino acid transport system ATP-binding protein
MKDVLECNKVSIQFGGLKAVNEVTLCVKERELVGLIGPNGAGKTTLFNLMTGIYQPTGGSISYAGECIRGFRPFEITNQCGAARTFQNIRLFKDLTVLENVLVAAHKKVHYGLLSILLDTARYREEERRIREEAMALLKIFGLDIKAEEFAKNLPYGDQRKLEIVRALATKPRILFLDEPAAGMNDNETQQLLKLVRFVRDEFKIGILVIEHDMRFIMGLCERIYVLDHGQLIAEGTPSEIRANPKVIKAYLGEDDENSKITAVSA